MKIIDNEGKETSQMVAIARYFRGKDESAAQFMRATQGLTPADKEELARGAAKELGWTVVED